MGVPFVLQRANRDRLMTEAYAWRFRKTRPNEDDYDHLCIDEGTAGFYCETPSKYDVTIVTWGSDS